MRKSIAFLVLCVVFLCAGSYDPGRPVKQAWGPVGQEADEGSLEVFSGTPDIESSNWDGADRCGYRKVIGGAADDKGGLVYAFTIPEGVVTLDSVKVTGKLGTASQDVITVRVKNQDGTQIATGTITAATKTTLTLTSWSPSPSLIEGEKIIVEVEATLDNTEEAFLGTCVLKGSR